MIENVSVCDLKMSKDLEEIENEIFTTAWPSETIKQKINNKEFKYWVYKKNDKLVAYLGVHFVNDLIEILGIGVIEEYRKNGIAGELMNELLDFFNKSSYLKIILEVRESNDTARKLIYKIGF